ncbi:MAG: hypothetical protein R3B90_10385 [Planctomycetaceae bacterium]
MTLTLVAVTACFSLAVAGRFLAFKTSRSDLIDPQAEFQQRWLHFVDRFGDQSDVVVVIEADDPALVRHVLDEVGGQLERQPELFARVHWKFSPEGLQAKGLQYLTPAELEQAVRRLESFGPILAGHWNRAGLESYCLRLAEHLKSAQRSGNAAEARASVTQASRLLASLVQFGDQFEIPAIQQVGNESASGDGEGVADEPEQPSRTKSASLVETTAQFGSLNEAGAPARLPDTDARPLDEFLAQGTPAFLSPWPEILAVDPARFAGRAEVRYQLTDDGTMGFVTAVPVAGGGDFSGASESLTHLRKLLDIAREVYPEVTFGLTGIPVLE